jgi:hypothetical protein
MENSEVRAQDVRAIILKKAAVLTIGGEVNEDAIIAYAFNRVSDRFVIRRDR